MTTFETLSIGISIVSMLIATYGIMAAMAASRAAKAAEAQADSASAQAHAAERQVEIMSRSMTFDHIGTALKIRRAALDAKEEVERTVQQVRMARGSGSRAVHQALLPLRTVAARLEDVPPVLPANVRKIMFGYVQSLNAVDFTSVTEAGGIPADAMDAEAGALICAIDVAISAMIQRMDAGAHSAASR